MIASSLYGIMNFSFAILLGILLFYVISSSSVKKQTDKVFMNLIIWVIIFCLLDGFWGLFNSKTLEVSPMFFFIFSSYLHFANVFTAFIWIYYFIAFVGNQFKEKIFLEVTAYFLITAEIVCLIINVFHPFIFSISQTSDYQIEKYRFVSLIFQYFGYFVVDIAAVCGLIKNKKNDRTKYLAVCVSSMAPLLLGIGKFFDANIPFNSTAFMFGCFIIHAFVCLRENEENNKTKNIELQEVLAAMTDAYEVITLLNIDTGEEKVFRTIKEIKSNIKGDENFVHYDARLVYFANSVVYSEDKDVVVNGLQCETIWKNIQGNKVYKVRYRIFRDEKLHWYEYRATQIKNSKYRCAVIGVRNITDEVMEEQQHQQILSSIASIYLTMHLIDLKENRTKKFYATSAVRGIANYTDSKEADSQFADVVKQVIDPEYIERTLDFVNFKTMQIRLEGKKSISEEIVGKTVGWVRAQLIPVSYGVDGKLEQVMFTTQIIDEEKRHEESIILMTKTDELTGIFNRRCYDEDLEMIGKNIPEKLIVVSADLNELKFANDNYGHSAGDELIIGAKDILTEVFGLYGRIYRTGGDEFIGLIVTDCSTEYLLADFNKKVKEWKGKEIKKISISIGFATKEDNPDLDLIQLCKLADENMYNNKADYYKKNKIERRKR